MVNPESSNDGNSGWLRRISLVVVVMCAVLLLQCWRWARGLGHWHDALPALAFVTLALTNFFERSTKYILQAISVVILMAAIAMLITRLWGRNPTNRWTRAAGASELKAKC
jgi:hypothetical protein